MRRFLFVSDATLPIIGWAESKAEFRAHVRREMGLAPDASLGRHAVVSIA